jgi:hypothetical protein
MTARPHGFSTLPLGAYGVKRGLPLGLWLSLASTLLKMTGSGAGMPPKEQRVIES